MASDNPQIRSPVTSKDVRVAQIVKDRLPLIERYRDRLPLAPDAPVVTLMEGSTPLVHAPRLSERLEIETHLKFEGMNPTGSFKDRGMTLAVSQAKANGAEAIICASTGNTAASAAAYAARAGVRGAVIVPEGKIAQGKLAQAVIHGSRVIALRGNFDQALEIVKQIVERQPVELVNSINPYRIEGQKTAAFEVCDELGAAPDALAIPVGNAGNITAWWKGFCEYGQGRPRLYGFQAEGAAPIVLGHPVERPETVASATRRAGPRPCRHSTRPEARSRPSVTRRSWRPSAGSRRTKACSASLRRPPASRAC
jgi:threonine synthase